MFLQSDVFYTSAARQKTFKAHGNFDYNNKSESICKMFGKIYIKFRQIKMKIYTTITDLEFSMSFANLFIGLLVQRFLVFSSKGYIKADKYFLFYKSRCGKCSPETKLFTK